MSNITNNIIAVIPAYNEEKSIENVVLLTKNYVNHVIVCDDGSIDATADIVSNLGVILTNHEKRIGKGYALRTLFKEAIKYDPDIIITIDADGQHDPYQIPLLLKPILLGESDMVVGSRFLKDSYTDISFIRNIGLRSLNLFQNILFHTKVTDYQSGFRAFSRKSFITVLNSKEGGYGIESEQLIIALKNGIRLSEIPVNIKYNNLPNTSKRNFVLHGLEIALTLLKLFFFKKILKLNNKGE